MAIQELDTPAGSLMEAKAALATDAPEMAEV